MFHRSTGGCRIKVTFETLQGCKAAKGFVFGDVHVYAVSASVSSASSGSGSYSSSRLRLGLALWIDVWVIFLGLLVAIETPSRFTRNPQYAVQCLQWYFSVAVWQGASFQVVGLRTFGRQAVPELVCTRKFFIREKPFLSAAQSFIFLFFLVQRGTIWRYLAFYGILLHG